MTRPRTLLCVAPLLLPAAMTAGCGDDGSPAPAEGATETGSEGTTAPSTTASGTATSTSSSSTTGSTTDATTGESSSGPNLTDGEGSSGGATGGGSDVPPRIVWLTIQVHGLWTDDGSLWPIDRDAELAPDFDTSPVFSALADLTAPVTVVEGLDNAIVTGDPEPYTSDSMARLLTAAAIVDDLAAGPSIDQRLGQGVDDVSTTTYFVGLAGAHETPMVYLDAQSPATPFADPLDTLGMFEGVPSLPSPPDFEYSAIDGAQIPALLAFHFDAAAAILAARAAAFSVVQVGRPEPWYRAPWLGTTTCGANELFHHFSGTDLECGDDVTWPELVAWSAEQAVAFAGALDAVTAEDGSSLLHHTLLVFAFDYGTTGPHTLQDIPVFVIGGEALGNTGPRFVDGEGHDQADLHLSIAQWAGFDLEDFGHPEHASTPIPDLAP